MVEVEFTTVDMVDIETHLNDYFNGHKAPKFNKDILKLLRKVNIIREGFEEFDKEEAEMAEKE